MRIKAKIIVKGLVQGVGYRYFSYRKAIEFGIKGYAKNLVNGNVEVLAEGEQHLIFDYVKELKIGPSDSKVTSMIVDEFPFENEFREFKIY